MPPTAHVRRLLLALALTLAPLALEARPLPTPQLITQAMELGELDAAQAHLYLALALFDDDRLPATFRSPTPWDGTPVLRRLRAYMATQPAGRLRDTFAQLLTGSCGRPTQPGDFIVDTTHFHVEYSDIRGGLAIGDYTAALESSWEREVTEYGWAAPPVLPSNPPPGNRYHVRIDNLPGGLYGYADEVGTHAGFVGDNPATPWNDGDAKASCIVLNDDFSGFPSPPIVSMQATVAHEFNHSLQYGWGALDGPNVPDDGFVEGGATWMEDEVFDAANDNYLFLWPTFSDCLGEYDGNPYALWVVFRALLERFGTGAANGGEQIFQEFWEQISQQSGSGVGALDTALGNAGLSLDEAYHDAAIALIFQRACGGGYVLPHCLEEGPGYVASAGPVATDGQVALPGSFSGVIGDNIALQWVELPRGARYSVRLENLGTGGRLRMSAVCDTGTELRPLALAADAGPGQAVESAFDATSCTRAVAVITNLELSAPDPGSCPQRSYRVTVGEPPPVLFAVRPPARLADVDLSWTGAVRSYTLSRGASVQTLAPYRTVTALADTDAGAVLPPPTIYMYQVE